jgi:hypothetical protein
VQQRGGSFEQQIGLKFKEETSESATSGASLFMVLGLWHFGK